MSRLAACVTTPPDVLQAGGLLVPVPPHPLLPASSHSKCPSPRPQPETQVSLFAPTASVCTVVAGSASAPAGC